MSNIFLNQMQNNSKLALCVAGLFPFAEANYDGVESVRSSSIVGSRFFISLKSHTQKQNIFDAMQYFNYIKKDEEKIGWLKLTSAGLNYFNEIKDLYFQDDFMYHLQDVIDRNLNVDNDATEYVAPLSARPNTICSKAGIWFAPNDGKREIRMNMGEKFPVAQSGSTGEMIWYRKSN
jgi:hypothetical protein